MSNRPETDNNPLWTKNFILITIGTIISRIGNSVAGFATGLLILDYTESTFLYALYMVLYNLPQIIMPTLAGPFIDKFSRRKTIYTLDFISTGIYLLFAVIIFSGNLNYVLLVLGCMLLGAIDSVYSVAYESFYPMLISEGNYTKAYSISSTLDSLTMLMVPVSAFLYNLVGIGPLFLIDMVSFFIAAVMETQIHVKESYVKEKNEEFGIRQYQKTFQEGVTYLKEEKGLCAIVLYFTVTMFAQGASNVIGLPYFKGAYPHGEYVYIAVMGFMLLGRLIGGAIHYKFKYPTDKKFLIALVVYMTISVLDGTYLYAPIHAMMVMCFISGIMGVTSYNIRISATQSYVPDGKKGRFNGIFHMAVTVGMMAGELLSGVMAEFMEKRLVVAIFMAINFVAVWGVMYRNRKHVAVIYNRQA